MQVLCGTLPFRTSLCPSTSMPSVSIALLGLTSISLPSRSPAMLSHRCSAQCSTFANPRNASPSRRPSRHCFPVANQMCSEQIPCSSEQFHSKAYCANPPQGRTKRFPCEAKVSQAIPSRCTSKPMHCDTVQFLGIAFHCPSERFRAEIFYARLRRTLAPYTPPSFTV